MLTITRDHNRDRHQDLVLVLEGETSLKIIADSYFLPDFFNFEETALKKVDDIPTEFTKALIQYWLQRFLSMEEGMSRFFPFDLSDQYISGLLIEKEPRGNKLQIVWSPEIGGWGINEPQLDFQLTQLSEGLKVSDQKVFYFTDAQIVGGLKESLNKLKPSFSKKKPPVFPGLDNLSFPEEQTEWLIQEINHRMLIYNPFGYGGALQQKETVYFTCANPEGDLNYFELKNGEWKQVPTKNDLIKPQEMASYIEKELEQPPKLRLAPRVICTFFIQHRNGRLGEISMVPRVLKGK